MKANNGPINNIQKASSNVSFGADFQKNSDFKRAGSRERAAEPPIAPEEPPIAKIDVKNFDY